MTEDAGTGDRPGIAGVRAVKENDGFAGEAEPRTPAGRRSGAERVGWARGEREASSEGRATHAARIADQVHVDPPPQAYIGVGHAPEYTTSARVNQWTSTVRS
ncbi:hypothetical protein GCM10010282_59150 [Streptomyces roseolus]|nr:hypothetical protein GCM10010282_59150 [Streptomyces roseolus]